MALAVRNPSANAGDLRDVGLIPGLRRSPGVGNGNPLQNSCLENPMDGGGWQATVLGVTKLDPTRWLSTRKHVQAQGIQSVSYTNFILSIIYKNIESLCYTPETNIIR